MCFSTCKRFRKKVVDSENMKDLQFSARPTDPSEKNNVKIIGNVKKFKDFFISQQNDEFLICLNFYFSLFKIPSHFCNILF